MKISINNYYDKGAKWQSKNDATDIYIVHNAHDKFNVKTTSANIVSKKMLNKNYSFIGVIDLSKNNKKVLERTCTYWNDCLTYEIKCVCGSFVRGWSDKECESNFDIHFCEKPKKNIKINNIIDKLSFKTEMTVEIKRVDFPRELTDNEKKEFNDWLKYKAAELGTGSFCEYYEELHEEFGSIEVLYKSNLVKLE